MLTIERKGAAIADRARDAAIARLAARIGAEAPDHDVSVEEGGIAITGRRVLSDPRLVWIGSLAR